MKVWELMKVLSDEPAGNDVLITDISTGAPSFNIDRVDIDDFVYLQGRSMPDNEGG